MARKFAKRSKGSFTRRTGKMFGNPKRAGSKRRAGGGKRKLSKPSATFAKRVKTVLYKQVESKKIVCYMPTNADLNAPFNLKGKAITFLGVDPLVSTTAAYNLLERRLGSSAASVAMIGGDPATLISTQPRIYGDSVLGDEMIPTSIRIRAEFRSAIWAPPSKTMVLLVMGNIGDTPTIATLFRNQTYNLFLDDFNYPRYQLIGRKDFTIGGVSAAMNKNADQQKAGGTGAEWATGTYWNAEGVSAVSDPQEAEMTENTVRFNGAASMQTFAPKVYLMDWTCSLKKVGKVTYNGGTYGSFQGNGFNSPAVIPKQKAMWLLAYNYANNLQGQTNQHANVFVDEIHWKLHFKDL